MQVQTIFVESLSKLNILFATIISFFGLFDFLHELFRNSLTVEMLELSSGRFVTFLCLWWKTFTWLIHPNVGMMFIWLAWFRVSCYLFFLFWNGFFFGVFFLLLFLQDRMYLRVNLSASFFFLHNIEWTWPCCTVYDVKLFAKHVSVCTVESAAKPCNLRSPSYTMHHPDGFSETLESFVKCMLGLALLKTVLDYVVLKRKM